MFFEAVYSDDGDQVVEDDGRANKTKRRVMKKVGVGVRVRVLHVQPRAMQSPSSLGVDAPTVASNPYYVRWCGADFLPCKSPLRTPAKGHDRSVPGCEAVGMPQL